MRGEKMQEITIYNKNGDPLTELAQWDKNVLIQICEKDIDDAYNVHFINCNSKEAMVVKSTYQDGTLYAVVPNDILTEPHPITGYIWAGDDVETDEEHKSIYCFRVVVRKRPKPANYVYKDQKEYVTFETVLKEASGSADSAKKSKDKARESEKKAEQYKKDAEKSEKKSSKSARKADTAARNAAESESYSLKYATSAKSYAVGGSGTRTNEDADNARYYCEQSQNNSSISKEYLTKVEQAGAAAVDAVKNALDIDAPNFSVDLSTGHLTYEGGRFMFQVNNTGHLEWRLSV